MKGDGSQLPSKQLQQLEGPPASALPVGRTGACQHLGGSPWTGGAGVKPLRPAAAACCREAVPRSWRQWHFKHCRCLLSGCESVFNFQALCCLGGSSLISPFCPSCRRGVNRELYVPHVRCHWCRTKRRSLPPRLPTWYCYVESPLLLFVS